ncbi:Bromodomain containing protein 7 [Bulinus truncatus]|nr:Bromodomain containing protein 7 [Bulinus truncatus]
MTNDMPSLRLRQLSNSIKMGSKKHKKHKSESRQAVEEGENGQDKPLRLKLNIKVGIGSCQESQPEAYGSPPVQTEERKHKHKKKKKKKSSDKDREKYKYSKEEVLIKRPLEDDESGDEEEEEVGVVSENIRDRDSSNKTGSDEDSDGNASPSRKFREPRSCTLRDSDGVILKQMLNHLLKILQNKDVNGFFAFPVTDSIAPGYSSIIHHPMDFSTIAAKIESNEYSNVMEFKKDFILMCNNAMTYNRPDTIYYKEAKRLLHIGIRQLSKEKLLHLKKTQSFLASITLRELGFDESGHVVETRIQQMSADIKDQVKEEPKLELENKYESIADDDLSPEEILAQAQDAAEKAKDLLTTRKPKTDLGFLRLEEDGTTSMTILNPWNDGMVSSTQKVISLGDYMGKLKSGSGSLFTLKEDKRNVICPETYLCYGPFSSHAPGYDSSFASCNKEESDLLLSTYGGEIGVQYAKSVQKFVENAGISAVEMVDKLLDTLTNGQHSKSCILLEQQKRREEEEAERALQDEMIVKAQKAAEEAEQASLKDPVQHKLNETAAMLSELSQTQNERLSQDPPPHLSFISPPSDKEADLADKVTSNLMTMTKHVHPSDVVSTKALRGAMGITTYPVSRNQQDNNTQGNTSNDDDDSEDDSSGDDMDEESMNDGDYSGDERGDKDEDSCPADQNMFDMDSA